MDDVDDDALPGQPARGTALRLYYHLRLVYVLGFLEALLGASIVVLEAAAIWIFYHQDLSYPLEIVGIFVGLFVICTGVLCFFAGRNRISPQVRHKLFICGSLAVFLALGATVAMFALSVVRTHYLHVHVRDQRNRSADPESVAYSLYLPYALSWEGLTHKAHLRTIAAVVYLVVSVLLLASLLLNILNIGRNKENVESTTNYAAVQKNPFVFPVKGRGKASEL